MKRMLLIATLTLAATTFALAHMSGKNANHSNQKGENVEKAVMQMEENLRAAVAKADAKEYAGIVGDNYVFTNHDAVVRTKAEMVSGYSGGTIKYDSLTFDDIKVYAYGDTAVVTGRSTSKGQDIGKDISGTFRYTRVYVKQQGKWQLVATQSTRIPAP